MIIDSPIISGSYAASGSLNQLGNVVISGSLTVTGSIIGTASFAETASYLSGYVSPFPFTGSAIISGSLDITGSFNVSGSGILLELNADVLEVTGSVIATSGFTGSLQGTASYAVTASNAVTASYLTGYVSPFPFTGSAIISGSLGVSGSLQVTNLSGSGVRYLVADESGSVTAQSASAALKSTQAFTSTAGQTTFSVTNGYSTGYVDVFINGSKLSTAEFTDTSGTNIVLATGSFSGDVVEVVKYTPAAGVTNNVLRQLTTLTGSAGQTVFSASYTPGLLDIFYNGSRLSTSDYTANNGTYFTLATASAADDILDVLVYSYQVGAFNGIGGAGVPTQIAYFNTTSSITGSNNFTIDGSTMTVTGSLVVSGSGTFTNIGPAVFSGSITALQGISGTASLASTASSADNFLVRNTLTAQTLIVQTITSSVDFVTGSTRFGSISENTHQFTGSMSVSGSGTFIGRIGTSLSSTGVNLANSSLYVNNTANTKGAIFGYNDTNDEFYITSLQHGVIFKPITISASNFSLSKVGDATFSSTLAVGTTISAQNGGTYAGSAEFAGILRIQGSGGRYFTSGNGLEFSYNSIYSYNRGTSAYNDLSINDSMVVKGGSGNVGIGTSSPSYLLHLSQATGNTAIFMKRVTNDTNFEISVQESRTRLRTWSTANDRDFYFDTDNAGTTRMIIKAGGDIQVNNALYWFGSDSKSYGFQQFADGYLSFVYLGFGTRATINGASGVYTPISDINVKKDFEDSTIGLDAIMGLKPTLYRFKSDENNESEKDLGFIAQQVKEFIPQAYKESGNFVGLQDRPILAAAVKAIQEQQALITALQEKLERNNII